jgi:hypothetical protein
MPTVRLGATRRPDMRKSISASVAPPARGERLAILAERHRFAFKAEPLDVEIQEERKVRLERRRCRPKSSDSPSPLL